MGDQALIVLGLGLAVLLLFIFRELFTWYWKLNQIVDNLKQLNDTQEKQRRLLMRMAIALDPTVQKDVE